MVSLMKTMIPGFGRTGFGRDEIDSLVGTVWIPEIPQNQDEKNIEKPPVPKQQFIPAWIFWKRIIQDAYNE